MILYMSLYKKMCEKLWSCLRNKLLKNDKEMNKCMHIEFNLHVYKKKNNNNNTK